MRSLITHSSPLELALNKQWRELAIVLERNCSNINEVGKCGNTVLILAIKDKQESIVKLLLNQPYIDVSITDAYDYTALDWAKKLKYYDCEELLENDAFLRITSSDYCIAFIKAFNNDSKRLQGKYDEGFFNSVIKHKPDLAIAMLNQCCTKSMTGELEFSNLRDLFGINYIKSSALYVILHTKDDSVRNRCLKHVVVKRLLDIKWELFGQRLFIQQLVLFALMLISMMATSSANYIRLTADLTALDTIDCAETADGFANFTISDLYSSTSANFNENCYNNYTETKKNIILNKFEWSLFTIVSIWLMSWWLTLAAVYHIRLLQPERLRHLVVSLYPSLDPSLNTPSLDFYKAKAKEYLVKKTLIWTVLLTGVSIFILRFFYSIYSVVHTILHCAVLIPGVVLWLCAFYFFLLEVSKILGEDHSFTITLETKHPCYYYFAYATTIVMTIFFPFTMAWKTHYRYYFSSMKNCFRLVTYWIVLVAYTPSQIQVYLELHTATVFDLQGGRTFAYAVYMYSSILILVHLWLMIAYYLRLHKSAGNFVALAMQAARDIRYFFYFYLLLFCGLVSAYYFLYQMSPKIPINGLWQTIWHTYFILPANVYQVDFSSEDNLSFEILGHILRVFHAIALTMILLNFLFGMMYRSIQDYNNSNIHVQSLAETLLELELSLFPTKKARSSLLNIHDQINPIFHEKKYPFEVLGEDYNSKELADLQVSTTESNPNT